MFRDIEDFIDRYKLLDDVRTVVAACSGGTDSLALVVVLAELREVYGYSLVVAHMDHGLRGAESEADYRFVESVATSMELPFCGCRANAAAFARERKLSLQEGARELRYTWLNEVARSYPAAVIATGHHCGDQGETVLLQLLRGAGSKGLGGIRPRQGAIIRPLLRVNRERTTAICRGKDLTPREDASNAKPIYLRNWVRLEVLPMLQERLTGEPEEILARTATILADEYDFIRRSAEKTLLEVADHRPGVYTFDCRSFSAQPIALQRESLRLAIGKIRGNCKGISLGHVEKLIGMLMRPVVGKKMLLPGGITACCRYDSMILSLREQDVPRQELTEHLLLVPGNTVCPEMDCTFTADFTEKWSGDTSNMAAFDVEQLQMPLVVRTRRPGDRFSPRGGIGSKKLKNYLIDCKVPQEERDHIPLVCAGDEILWVCGYRTGKSAAPTAATKKILVLCWEKNIGGIVKGDGAEHDG